MNKPRPTSTLARRLTDTTGASLVIALLFFLICAVVGSTVLTAASVNAMSTANYREARQAEYTVSSAAALMADALQREVRVEWDWSNVSTATPTVAPTATVIAPESAELARVVWGQVAAELWQNVDSTWKPHEVTLSDLEIAGIADMGTVYARITVDVDFCVTVLLSLQTAVSNTASPYDETVYLQARPEYKDGKLTALIWERPVITKTGSR
ncbi:MAG TPA: hypothetical protein DEB24_08535 [Coriobacteriia bacterium]|nr:hypothetical protein [Coriobacteriia bacterium]